MSKDSDEENRLCFFFFLVFLFPKLIIELDEFSVSSFDSELDSKMPGRLQMEPHNRVEFDNSLLILPVTLEVPSL